MTQIHGHRGFRGRYPENSIKGFVEAKKTGVDAIELDLVVSKDLQLLVNHDPWLKSGDYMINKIGDVPDFDVNLYQKTTEEISQYALGTKRNLNFLNQITFPHSIPIFQDVVSHPELQSTYWNIEVKSEEEWYDLYQPQPELLAQLVHAFIINHKLENNCLVQSFDPKLLNHLKSINPKYPIGFLVENQLGLDENLKKLNFRPDFYNPDEILVDKNLISSIHKKNIKCLVWTVNELGRAKELIKWGVDGLITDYPDNIKK